jgi:UTP--glucose-1-phosphate uridylyltransferase
VAKITKAVIAAAGFGTRFLPQTKAMPKEMLPLIDKPIIQYVVEELVDAGIEDIIVVGSSNKRAIEDHFDLPSEDLVANLQAGGPSKAHYIEELERIANLANFIYIRQKGPYGTGTPLMNVAHIIGNEPFIYTYPDDLTIATPNVFRQMMDVYEEFNASVVPCIRISEDDEYDRYGVLAGSEIRPGVLRMSGVAEKPGKANAPSDFANVGTYLLTPDIFGYLDQGLRNLQDGKEFLVTSDVFEPMLRDGLPFYGHIVRNSVRYDTGTQIEYLKTLFAFALRHDKLGAELREFLRTQLAEDALR